MMSVRYLKSGRSSSTFTSSGSLITSLRAVLISTAPLGMLDSRAWPMEFFVSFVAGMCSEMYWQVLYSSSADATAFTPSASITSEGQNAS